MDALPASISGHQVCTWYLWSLQGFRCSGTVATDSWDLVCECRKLTLGPLEEQLVPLTIKPPCQLRADSYCFRPRVSKHLICTSLLCKYFNVYHFLTKPFPRFPFSSLINAYTLGKIKKT